jgi:cellulose synthase (UDP-forming)
VFLAGTLLAVGHRDIPYIPTAKEAVRGRFLRLAWPQLALCALFGLTLARVAVRRLRETPEGAVALSSEAVWGMAFFAFIPVLASLGTIRAAWQSRTPPTRPAWHEIPLPVTREVP